MCPDAARVRSDHRLDLKNAKILNFETNFLISQTESFYTNGDERAMNEKRWDLCPDIYRFILQ